MKLLKDHLRNEFFWRNQSITWRRMKEIARKIRDRGVVWLMSRLMKEIRVPETIEGKYIRAGLVWLYGLMLHLIFSLGFLFSRILWTGRKTLYYFYDLEVAPLTFDVADYLVLAEMERRNRGLENLYVVVVPGRRAGLRSEAVDYEHTIEKSELNWRLQHLVIPMFDLLPSCCGFSRCQSRGQATLLRILAGKHIYPKGYWPAFPIGLFRRPILEASRHGIPVFPIFRSPEASLKYVRRWLDTRIGTKKGIVITLRCYEYDQSRNSNLENWATFAQNLDSDDFVPVFVLDTDKAMSALPRVLKEFQVFFEAPWNIALRSALYEIAYLNMAVVHGPTELLWYNDRCRYLLFLPTMDSIQTNPESLRANGFIPGESLPFATPFQKWVWGKDDVELLHREFSLMCDVIEKPEEPLHAAERLAKERVMVGKAHPTCW